MAVKHVLFAAKAKTFAYFKHTPEYAVLATKKAKKDAKKMIEHNFNYWRYETKKKAKEAVRKDEFLWKTEKRRMIKPKEYRLKLI